MIDIKLIREDPDLVRENIRKKFQDAKLPLVDEAIHLDGRNRAAITEADELRLKISLDLKRFSQARWATVKEMIDDLIKNDIIKGEN